MVSNQKYKPFNVGDIFFITNGKGITRQEIKDHPGELAAIQSAATNNGIMGFIDEDYCRERNYSFTLEPCLTVARTGSSGYVTFQEHGCCVGDSAKLLLLKGKKKTKNIYLYLRTILMANKYRYTFARKVTEENYLNDIIELPINEDDEIDYEYMENYIMQINGDVASIPDYFLQEGYEKACWYLDTIDQDDFEKEYAGKICDDEIVLDINLEKLFFNMLEAKAEYLYNLPQWDAIFSPEKRREIQKAYRESCSVRNENKVGRNDACPCGSGKKYKKCCGK